MRIIRQLNYITTRLMFFGAAVLIYLLLLLIILLTTVLSGTLPGIIFLLTVIVGIALVFVLIVWIIRPYQEYTRVVQHVIDGYFTAGDAGKDHVAPSHSTQLLLNSLSKTVTDSQTIELNKRQAQYLALQNQINPHFLYNTLESIRSETLIAGLDSVADMTEALARFFRYTISQVENLVSVEEELQNCETYFRIQRYRFGDRLSLHIDHDRDDWDEILRCMIPKLTLQPILENSIIHGIELKVGHGNVHIQFLRTEKRLIILISDDGIGMDDETLMKLNKRLGRNEDRMIYHSQNSGGGIALVNVNNRIKLIFGEEYGVHVFSVPQKGTDVEITLPLNHNDPSENDLENQE